MTPKRFIIMKKYIPSFLSVIVCLSGFAISTLKAQTPDRHYTKGTVPRQPVKTTEALEQLTDSLKAVQITYRDGLGRTVQTISQKASPSGKDIVAFTEYDALGKNNKVWLPYTAASEQGDFRKTPATEQKQFFQNSGIPYANHPYAEREDDGSVLGRTIREGNFGDWHQLNSNHTKKYDVFPCKAQEVKIWQIDENTDKPVSLGWYPEGGLTVSSVKDEEDHEVLEYKNHDGQTILKKVKADDNAWAQTFYIYDRMGVLRTVVQPEGVKKLESNNGLFTNDILEKYCFTYKYDGRQRLIEKKVPSSALQYLIYDKVDRIVLSQDGMFRADNEWQFVKYDAWGRTILMGIYKDLVHTSREAMQAFIDSSPEYFEVMASNTWGYTTDHALPKENLEVLNVYYFDDYDFNNDGAVDFSPQADADFEAPSPEQPQGMPTGFKTKLLGSDTWQASAVFYDRYDRTVQMIAENHLGGKDVLFTAYNFDGLSPRSKRIHCQDNNTCNLTVFERYEYDRSGRLTKILHHINDEPEVISAAYEYNETGQITNKKLFSADQGKNFLQDVRHAYDILGRLRKVNDPQLSGGNDLFGLELVYDDSFQDLGIQARYDGNLVASVRNSATDKIMKGFAYEYDPMKRLKTAIYDQCFPGDMEGHFGGAIGKYNTENLSYDLNGNILSMFNFGKTGEQNNQETFDMTDALQYQYSGNKLMAANDDADNGQKGFDLGFTDQGSKGSLNNPEYLYDADGRLVEDKNKQMKLSYNRLGLVSEMTLQPDLKISILYNASGNRLRKTVYQSGVEKERYDYLGGIEYRNGKPTFLDHAEGRIAFVEEGNKLKPHYLYDYRDQLGNVCLTWTAEAGNTASYVCTMEVNKDEEGEFPKFKNVAATRTNQAAKEGQSSSVLSQNQTGPLIEIPVQDGDEYEAGVWYFANMKYMPWVLPLSDSEGKSPNLAIQTDGRLSAAPEPEKKRKKKNRTNFLKTVLPSLTVGADNTVPQAPRSEKRQAFTADNLRLTLGFSPGNLNSNKIPPLNEQKEEFVPQPISTQGYLRMELYDEDNQLLQTVSREGDNGQGVWDTLQAALKVNLANTQTKKGMLKVYVKNEGPGTLFFDSLYILKKMVYKTHIVQETHYRPFGGSLESLKTDNGQYAALNTLYNGKELDTLSRLYDYGARMYDPQLGLWQSQDPLADYFRGISPYNYVFNNPTNWIDPDGRAAVKYILGNLAITVDWGAGSATWGAADEDNSLDPAAAGGPEEEGGGLDGGPEEDKKKQDSGTNNQEKKPEGWSVPEWFYDPHARSTGRDIENASNFNNWVGITLGGMEQLTLSGQGKYITSKGLVRDINFLKLTNHSRPYAAMNQLMKGASKLSTYAGFAFDLYSYKTNQMSGAKFALNTGITIWSNYTGTAGFIGSTMYNLIDMYYPGGWYGAMQNNGKLIEQNQKILGPQFNLYREGGIPPSFFQNLFK